MVPRTTQNATIEKLLRALAEDSPAGPAQVAIVFTSRAPVALEPDLVGEKVRLALTRAPMTLADRKLAAHTKAKETLVEACGGDQWDAQTNACYSTMVAIEYFIEGGKHKAYLNRCAVAAHWAACGREEEARWQVEYLQRRLTEEDKRRQLTPNSDRSRLSSLAD